MLLYVIAESEFGPCKLGYADQPERRLSYLQIGNPRKLTLAFTMQAPPSHRLAERTAHAMAAMLSKHNATLYGEWFNITVQDAIKITQKACARVAKVKPIPLPKPPLLAAFEQIVKVKGSFWHASRGPRFSEPRPKGF